MPRTWRIEAKRDASARPVRVVLFGLGPIGVLAGKLVHSKECLEIVGAIDIDPKKVGKDVGELLGTAKVGVVVSDRVTETLTAAKADIAVQTTSSHMPNVGPQLADIIATGTNIVSSTEELLYPYLQSSEIGDEIDKLAKEHGVTVLGTGVNPGFVMDTLALVTTFACREVRSIRVTRVVDAATRRGPLQRKVGAGMAPEEFRCEVEAGRMGHVGLVESIAFLASGLGWAVDRIEEQIEPVVADASVKTDYFDVRPGQVKGIHQTGAGWVKGEKVIEMDLLMCMAPDEPGDRIQVSGDPDMDIRICGGTPGDVATPAALVNAIPRVLAAAPGLVTMKDISLPSVLAAGRMRIEGRAGG
ncbi:MAG: dihydrodipicolinate reductase [Planctomycetes bacterium]|nr:dihydrodipicolinate reductase [Planctomycetota bacterium]